MRLRAILSNRNWGLPSILLGTAIITTAVISHGLADTKPVLTPVQEPVPTVTKLTPREQRLAEQKKKAPIIPVVVVQPGDSTEIVLSSPRIG